MVPVHHECYYMIDRWVLNLFIELLMHCCNSMRTSISPAPLGQYNARGSRSETVSPDMQAPGIIASQT